MSSEPVSADGLAAAGFAVGELAAGQGGAVLALAERASAADAVAPLSERVMLHLRYDPPVRGRDFVVIADGQIAGYGYLVRDGGAAEVSGELVVDPARRGRGLGRALVRALAAGAGRHTLRVWAHGELPAAVRLAGTEGFERFRALWQMRRPLAGPLDEFVLPAGYALRTFVPGRDEQEWLGLNGRAFAKHPEQGAWTLHDLELREREPWFDPAGFFIAAKDGVMAGFHWTKVHDARTGEVYVVGVDPAGQGSGLGRALTLAGLHHLRDLGLAEVLLYVDEDNTPAIRMYEALGFGRTRTDAMYRRRAQPGRPG